MAQVRKKYLNIIVFAVLIIFAAFIIFPILVVLMNSVKGNLFISSTGAFKLPNEQSFVGMSNYANGIEKISFFSAFGYSLSSMNAVTGVLPRSVVMNQSNTFSLPI